MGNVGLTSDEVVLHKDSRVLRSLLHVGVSLSVLSDTQELLDLILREACNLSHAEAGSLYIVRKGTLVLAAVENDKLARTQIVQHLLHKEMAVSADSLVGFVVSTGETINVPNSYTLDSGAPFRVNRDLDAETGYRAKSILAIPLKSPRGKTMGVLQLFNCLNGEGKIVPFDESTSEGVLSLAAMAAVTIHNAKLEEELRKAHLETIVRLSVAAEFRDDETSSHVRRVSHTSALVAKAFGLDAKHVELIRYASPMHDVGKIGVPDAVLSKPGKLTAEERLTMMEHAAIGPEILGDQANEVMAMARTIALTHHERWNGQGYPEGLAGELIPTGGRIVAIADVFDALVSKRCYKEAMSIEQATEVIRQERGQAFDPAVVDAFFASLDAILLLYRDPNVCLKWGVELQTGE